MNFDPSVLNNEEKAIFTLRSLYNKYGYSPYKMSKFEEYDLYVKNKNFLISDNIITFTDTNGKLMALKPDVTLSIIKNSKDIPGAVQKLYYNENVYRVSQGAHAFKEIMQTGLECIGDIDDSCIGEVLMLAARSLNSISSDFILDISHLGILEAFVNEISSAPEIRQALMKCAGEKNPHEIHAICLENDIDPGKAENLKQLISVYGTADEVLPKLKTIAGDTDITEAIHQLEAAASVFGDGPLKNSIHIDFSVISDMKYYNGIVFKGFINHIPDSVLSGGQYDRLMRKMNRKSKAIGFAVYLDTLERLQ